jgi:CobQ-like glutamine amidotransferase family enzyme
MKKIRILNLYPDEMNIYGDSGNVLTLTRRLQWHGYDSEVLFFHPGDTFPNDVDLVIGGGGQDSGQKKISNDLIRIAPNLKKLAEGGVPMLMICGLFQLFGHRFVTENGTEIKGISIFDAETIAKDKRLIGNIVIETDFGKVIGYENHSGQTFLKNGQKPFGTIIKGEGNNADDRTEGARTNNVFGSYLHGSLLPKNPVFADYLIKTAVQKKFGKSSTLKKLDESISTRTRESAESRPR